VIKLDIVNEVVSRTGIPKRKAAAAVDRVFEKMREALTRGERIELRGFAIFDVRPRKTGIARYLLSGTELPIAPGKVVRFKPGKGLQTLE
jgi:DNA-binding protein HU-beta